MSEVSNSKKILLKRSAITDKLNVEREEWIERNRKTNPEPEQNKIEFTMAEALAVLKQSVVEAKQMNEKWNSVKIKISKT